VARKEMERLGIPRPPGVALGAREPSRHPRAHERAEARERLARPEIGRCRIGMHGRRERQPVDAFDEAEREPEDVVREVGERAIALGRGPLHARFGNRAHERFRRREDGVEALGEHDR